MNTKSLGKATRPRKAEPSSQRDGVATQGSDPCVAVVGLGYVGLPLAIEFGNHFPTIGFDLSADKVSQYQKSRDPSGEMTESQFRSARRLKFTTQPSMLKDADFVVVAVPTPVDDARLPDFEPLKSACRSLGPYLKNGATVIFESTVYPGATEEICIPEIERVSGKKWKEHFFVGYSPERINPGDKAHTLARVVKVVAGDSPDTLEKVASIYGRIVTAGVHRASSIRVAEAAKVIENTQRDLNIALMNELAVVFHKMGIDTAEVLAAAGTKWNFLNFKPGLVGGHCIGVDPYYLTHAAERLGHHPEVILAGRRINDSMGKYVAEQTVKCIVKQGRRLSSARVNILGFAFKENCADCRNTKVFDVMRELRQYGIDVAVNDPRVDANEVRQHYGLTLTSWDSLPKADAIIMAVPHHEFLKLPMDELASKAASGGWIIDVKSVLDPRGLSERGLHVWRL